jgi:uncharacterized protein (TIGR03000 family)
MNPPRPLIALAVLAALFTPATAGAQFGVLAPRARVIYPVPSNFVTGGYYPAPPVVHPWALSYWHTMPYTYAPAVAAAPGPYSYGGPYSSYGSNFGGVRTTYDPPPRMRPTLEPAVPFTAERLADGSRALVDVSVPRGDALVWLDGVLMNQTGTVRTFRTPPLEPGATYTYEVRASWTDAAGKQHAQTRQVDVRAGARPQVQFAVGL